MIKKMYEHIASLIDARARCNKTNNTEWFEKHSNALTQLEDFLPSGSGFDKGSHIDLDASTGERIVINTSFHHMDDNGYYCGWSDHQVIVTGSLQFGTSIRVTGRNVRDIKSYIHEEFHEILTASLKHDSGRFESAQ